MSFYAHTCGFSWAFLYLRADHVGLVVSWVTGQRLSSNLGLVFFLVISPVVVVKFYCSPLIPSFLVSF